MNKKIRYNPLLKTTAFILSVILFTATSGGGIAAFVAFKQNLLFADRSDIAYTIMRYAADYTADDIIQYYYISKNASEETSDYYVNEEKLYAEKYSPAKSNISFNVTNNEGTVLLENEKKPLDSDFTYTVPFYDSSNDPTINESRFTVEFSEYSDPTTTYAPDEIEEAATTQEEYAVINSILYSSSYFTAEMEYTYPDDGFSQTIYDYCYAVAKKYYTTIETDYPVLIMKFSQNDFSEDEDAIKNSYDSVYTQRNINISVSCNVSNLEAADIFLYAARASGIISGFLNHTIIILALSFAFMLICAIYLLLTVGYDGEGNKKASGIHKAPFDLLAVLSVVACAAVVIASGGNDLILLFIIWTAAFLLWGLLLTAIARIRSGVFLRRNLTVSIVKGIIRLLGTAKSFAGTLITVFAVYAVITIAEGLLLAATQAEDGLVFVFILYKLFACVAIVFLVNALKTIQDGASRMSNGDFTQKIKESGLFGPLRKHAVNLNRINSAVNVAIEERMKSESMKTELITNVSHDLKTPLTSIVNYIDLLKKTDISDEKALEYIGIIDRQSQKLKKLTTDLVEASKASTGNIEVNFQPTNLNVILSQTDGEYEEKLEEKRLTLVQEIPTEEIIITSDGRLLWRVIDNLMNNICKYSMPGTRVYVSLFRNEGNAVLSFRNISAQELNISPEQLTERFVRSDESRGMTEGSGLGLSIAKSITELLGGELRLSIDGDLFKAEVILPIAD